MCYENRDCECPGYFQAPISLCCCFLSLCGLENLVLEIIIPVVFFFTWSRFRVADVFPMEGAAPPAFLRHPQLSPSLERLPLAINDVMGASHIPGIHGFPGSGWESPANPCSALPCH